MFSSRNIHFAILGIILGATFGYILAFYQVQASMGPAVSRSASSNLPNGHPNVTNEQVLAMFKEALRRNRNNPRLITNKPTSFSDLERRRKPADGLQKSLHLQRRTATA